MNWYVAVAYAGVLLALVAVWLLAGKLTDHTKDCDRRHHHL